VLNPVAYNPGYAGMSGQISARYIERKQWLEIEGYPKKSVLKKDK